MEIDEGLPERNVPDFNNSPSLQLQNHKGTSLMGS